MIGGHRLQLHLDEFAASQVTANEQPRNRGHTEAALEQTVVRDSADQVDRQRLGVISLLLTPSMPTTRSSSPPVALSQCGSQIDEEVDFQYPKTGVQLAN